MGCRSAIMQFPERLHSKRRTALAPGDADCGALKARELRRKVTVYTQGITSITVTAHIIYRRKYAETLSAPSPSFPQRVVDAEADQLCGRTLHPGRQQRTLAAHSSGRSRTQVPKLRRLGLLDGHHQALSSQHYFRRQLRESAAKWSAPETKLCRRGVHRGDTVCTGDNQGQNLTVTPV
jgi:hypothetical protein